MFTYNLTEEQKNMLSLAVRTIREANVDNRFYCSFDMQGAEIIGIHNRFTWSLKSDLIALAEADLVTLEHTGHHDDLIFSIKQAGIDAVNNNFQSPILPSGLGLSVGAIIYGDVSGGNIQAVGFADHAEIQQILNDPRQLNDKIEEYLNKLTELVLSELTRRQQLDYLAIAEQFKEEMISDKPEPGKIQRLLQSLAFLGDIEGTISLISRVWPYLYPLVVLSAELFRR